MVVRTNAPESAHAQRAGHEPSRRARRRRRRRVPRRVRLTVTICVSVLLAWLCWSVGGALTAPGTDTTTARLAEWGRTHHLGWAVTDLERIQYDLNKPKTGGTVAGGIPVVGATSGTSQPSPTARGSATRQRSTKPPRRSTSAAHAAPAPLLPLVSAPLHGEGQWQSLLEVKGKTAVRVALLRPDTVHTSYLVSVVWMDPSLLRFRLHPGYQVPGSPLTAPDEIPATQRGSVLAAFNSGFQMVDAHGGYWQNGTKVRTLRPGGASMVFTKSGGLSVEAWPGGTPGPGIAAVRQNLSMLIDHGHVSPQVASPSTKTWGVTVGNAAYVWRSAIGVRKDGTVVFVVGPSMGIRSLTNVLKRAGAVDAMELDINQDWTNFLTFTHPAPGQAVPHRLTSNQLPNAYRYLQPSTRDFVAVFGS